MFTKEAIPKVVVDETDLSSGKLFGHQQLNLVFDLDSESLFQQKIFSSFRFK